MSIIVQKFGGTSVATTEKILAAAQTAVHTQQQGHQVVMVVSAMGKNTDMLTALASEIMQQPPAREMDMLLSTGEQVSVALMAMAITSLGHKAISLAGAQIGIKTDNVFGKARIISISTDRMQKLLDDGNVVIAAGFQGIDDDFNITTLGRGGSDTTAVALAAVLGAECEIYTDVDGVYSADPRVVSNARWLSHTSYDEMLELASMGAGVMHSRSIEFAKKFAVPIHVRSSSSESTGTIISNISEDPNRAVSGTAVTFNEALITLSGVPDQPGSTNAIFASIAKANITVDMIVQDAAKQGKSNISFTIPSGELQATLDLIQPTLDTLQVQRVSHRDDVSKISVVGMGMAVQSGVSNRMFRCLADQGVNIFMITTSQIKISALVAREQAELAIHTVHSKFELEQASHPDRQAESPAITPVADSAAAANRLRDMEELSITDIGLDESQASISIEGIPDTPGVAATIFDATAKAGVVVDMIIQSYLDQDNIASITLTVPRCDVEKTVEVFQQLIGDFPGEQEIVCNPAIAIVSVNGIGMRSHTGVALRMFQALADAEINIEMMNTSEMRVSIVVDSAGASRAEQALTQAFADVYH
jgi:aspartate kinase